MVFSDAVHHLNNPLNHIVGSNQVTHDLSTHLNDDLNVLLHTDPIDPETEEVRLRFDHQFKDIILQLETIEEASSRASDTVSLLRIVSGIDGTPISATKAGEIFEIAMRRLPGLTVKAYAAARDTGRYLSDWTPGSLRASYRARRASP